MLITFIKAFTESNRSFTIVPFYIETERENKKSQIQQSRTDSFLTTIPFLVY